VPHADFINKLRDDPEFTGVWAWLAQIYSFNAACAQTSIMSRADAGRAFFGARRPDPEA